MSTGDIKNNLRKLKVELKRIGYPNVIDFEKMSIGVTEPFLPILHFVFLEFSVELSGFFAKKGYDCYGKSDLRFIEVIYKIIIQEFNMKPMLTKEQFFSIGFAEVKVIFVTKLLQLCQQKLKSIQPKTLKKTTVTYLHTQLSKSNQAYELAPSKMENDEELPNVNMQTNIMIPPQSTPNLTLTPIKQQQKHKEHHESQRLHCSLLDVTDMESGEYCDKKTHFDTQVEFVDVEDDEILPNYVVQKHNIVSPVNKKNNQPISHSCQDLKSNNMSFPRRNQCLGELEHDVQNEINECKQCCINKKEICDLKGKIEVLEKSMSGVVHINNELSAKFILMEMKFKVLESTFQMRNTSISPPTVQFKNNLDPLAHYDYTEESENINKVQNDSYSPVRYSDNNDNDYSTDNVVSKSENGVEDDIVILKNFKPIRMTDIQSTHMYNANVENETKQLLGTHVGNFHVELNGNGTRQVVMNVKKKLMETERLLKFNSKT